MTQGIRILVPLALVIAFLTAMPRAAFAAPTDCTSRHMEVFGAKIHSAQECFELKDAVKLGAAMQKAGFGSSDPGKMLDFTFAVVGMAMPAAAPVLGVAKMGLGMLGVFKEPDPMAILAGRVDRLEQEMSALSSRVDDLQRQFANDIQSLKLNDLSFIRGDLGRCAVTLQSQSLVFPGRSGASMKEIQGCRIEMQTALETLERIDEAQKLSLWMANSFHVKYDPVTKKHLGLVLAPNFQPLPVLPVYQSVLAMWIATVEMETNGNVARIRSQFKEELDKHRDFLTGQLAREIGGLVSCGIRLTAVYPVSGACRVEDACNDHLKRESPVFPRPQDSFTPKINSGGRCDFDFFPGDFERFSEQRLESAYGMAIIEELLGGLDRLEKTGSMREPQQPRFSCSSTSANYLYTVEVTGELGWRMHEITSQCPDEAKKPWQDSVTRYKGKESMRQAVVTPWQQASSGRAVAVESKPPATGAVTSKGTGGVAGVLTTGPVRQTPAQESPVARLYTPGISPELVTVKAIAVESDRVISHQLRAAKSLGGKWNSFRQVLPGGLVKVATNRVAFVIYGLTPEGQLKWYRHDGSGDGTAAFKGPLDVPAAWNWNSYTKLIPAAEGVIYGLTPDGQLVWHRHMDILNGTPRWEGPRTVASGWGQYQRIVSSGQGVLYAVSATDLLIWQRHLGYLDGSPAWAKSVPVDSGWSQFRNVFSPGSGQLYALGQNGTLLMATHSGFLTGENKWSLAARVADGFDTTTTVFPLMWGDPQPPDVR